MSGAEESTGGQAFDLNAMTESDWAQLGRQLAAAATELERKARGFAHVIERHGLVSREAGTAGNRVSAAVQDFMLWFDIANRASSASSATPAEPGS